MLEVSVDVTDRGVTGGNWDSDKRKAYKRLTDLIDLQFYFVFIIFALNFKIKISVLLA